MSTNTTDPPPSNPAQEQRERILHNAAIGMVIVCPLLIIMPPRKLDIYTFSLVIVTGLGANRLLEERYGHGILGRIRSMNTLSGLPSERAREMQMKLREAKADKDKQAIVDRLRKARQGDEQSLIAAAAAELRWETEAAAEARRQDEENNRGVLERVWMGKEKPDWKKERDKREKEALEEGKGYGDLIMNQIWEVWNWGQDKAEDAKQRDEKAVEVKEEKRDEE